MRKILLLACFSMSLIVKGQVKYDSIEHVLTTIFNQDQAYRGGIDSTQKKYGWNSPQLNALVKKMHYADSTNLISVKSSLATYGWLGVDEVGEKANLAQFLVIQHADTATQAGYLPTLRSAVAMGKAQASYQALLEDRVLTNQGKPQLYGSQVRKNAKGNFEFFPIADEASVNQRRAAMGLEPIESYARGFGIDYHAPVK